MNSLFVRTGLVILLTVLALGPLSAQGSPMRDSSGPSSDDPVPSAAVEGKRDRPKMESTLHQYAVDFQQAGPDQAKPLTERYGVQESEGLIRVVIEAAHDRIDEVATEMESLGAKEETRHGNLLQMRVPGDALWDVAASPNVHFVRRPWLAQSRPAVPSPTSEAAQNESSPAVVTEGAQVIGADAWWSAGFRGQGAKVAVLDLGFVGYEFLLGAELPSSVVTQSFRFDGDIAPIGENHGTACAEIVHSVAPDAQLLLVNFETDVEWANAVDFIIEQGVDIVSSSIVFLVGPFDGTGFFSDKVSEARSAGVFWAQSAGNYAEEHWEGEFSDDNGNGMLDFAPGVEQNAFTVPPFSFIGIFLSWNDWPASSQDYDLVLYQNVDGIWEEVANSANAQFGTQEPFEIIAGITRDGGTFGLSIINYSATQNVRFQLFTIGVEPEFQVAATSLAIPADSPGAVAVGATFFADDNIEPFSSQGPTVDGRTKPDLVAPDGVSTATFGPQQFLGTSSSAPHVAGAAALAKSAEPALGVAEIRAFLEERAIPMGPAGKNDVFGFGRLDMGPPGIGLAQATEEIGAVVDMTVVVPQ